MFSCLLKLRLGFPPGVLSVPPDAQRHPSQLLSVLLHAVCDGGASLERRPGARLLPAAAAAAVSVLAGLPLGSALLLLRPHGRVRQLQQSLHVTGARAAHGLLPAVSEVSVDGVLLFLSAVFSVVSVFAAAGFASFDVEFETRPRAAAAVVCGTGELNMRTFMHF